MYLPEYLSAELFIEFIDKCHKLLTTSTNKKTLIIGDFNLGDMKWTDSKKIPQSYSCAKSQTLYNFFHTLDISQLNYILNHNARLLDLAITDSAECFKLTNAPP